MRGRSRLIRIASPHGAVNYEYDPATDLRTRVFTGASGTYSGDQTDPVNDFHYTYDTLGRLESVEVWERNDVADGTEADGAVDQVFKYLYDKNDRLLTEQADLDNDGIDDHTTDYGYTGTQQTSKTCSVKKLVRSTNAGKAGS